MNALAAAMLIAKSTPLGVTFCPVIRSHGQNGSAILLEPPRIKETLI